MDLVLDSGKCTGCGACMNICPVDAVSMCDDSQGFSHPVINKKLCIDCGRCNNTCPISKDNNGTMASPLKVYAAWSNNEDTRYNSSSGGVFTELAAKILSLGGVVCAAAYNENMSVEHIIIDDISQIDRLRRSKYVQSNINYIYRNIQSYLAKGVPVLFCGCPCQAAALVTFLGREYDNLYILDFICHGVSSPMAYTCWLSSLERKYNGHALAVNFRSKIFGWKYSYTVVDFSNGNAMKKSRMSDIFRKSYVEDNLIVRPSCAGCSFKGYNRYSDITLGDFWRADSSIDDDKGINAIIINSTKGKEIFDSISSSLTAYDSSIDAVRKGNPNYDISVTLSEHGNDFFRLLNEGVDYMEAYQMVTGRQNNLLSIILPVTAPVDNIEAIVDSYVNCGYEPIELIISDVTGNSEFADRIHKLCEKYINVVHVTGEGNFITARNIGLQNSSGAFIHFITSGLTVNKGTYDRVINAMTENDYAVYTMGYSVNNIASTTNAFCGVGNQAAFIHSLEGSDLTYGPFIWNKIFRRSCVKVADSVIVFDQSAYAMADLLWLVKASINVCNGFFDSTIRLNTDNASPYITLLPGMNMKFMADSISRALHIISGISESLYNEFLFYLYTYEIQLYNLAVSKNFEKLSEGIHSHLADYYNIEFKDGQFLDIMCESYSTRRENAILSSRINAKDKMIAFRDTKINSLTSANDKLSTTLSKEQSLTKALKKEVAHYKWLYEKECAESERLRRRTIRSQIKSKFKNYLRKLKHRLFKKK